jgi:hypothetical protein
MAHPYSIVVAGRPQARGGTISQVKCVAGVRAAVAWGRLADRIFYHTRLKTVKCFKRRAAPAVQLSIDILRGYDTLIGVFAAGPRPGIAP